MGWLNNHEVWVTKMWVINTKTQLSMVADFPEELEHPLQINSDHPLQRPPFTMENLEELGRSIPFRTTAHHGGAPYTRPGPTPCLSKLACYGDLLLVPSSHLTAAPPPILQSMHLQV